MEATMLAVRLSGEIERRLDALAARTGRSKTVFAREAIETHIEDLEDLEDFYLAEERLRDFHEADTIPLSDLKAELGLAD
jgi:RHH-type rel operon transcriptional repressor/antitoxin RelB